MLDSRLITVSGVSNFTDDDIINVDIGQVFVPGTTGGPGGANSTSAIGNLVSFQAEFGMNNTPHNFTFQFAIENITFNTLPTIGKIVELTIKDFYVKGEVTHADISKAENGYTINLGVQDLRTTLNDTVIDTFGIYQDINSVPSGLVDVAAQVFSNGEGGGQIAARNLRIFVDEGATYKEIYNAIPADIQAKIPSPEEIAGQLDADPDSFRWQVRAQPLLEFMNRILGDVALDFYWDMRAGQIRTINRKINQTIDQETHFLLSSDNVIKSKVGKDKGERATRGLIYGAQMEGLAGSGAGQLATSRFNYGNLGIETGLGVFRPAWRNARVKYFKADGFPDIDRPTDRELAAALKGIEYWAFEKGLDNRIAKSTSRTSSTGGPTARGFSPSAASGLNLIPNRVGNINQAWVVDWYNRVRNFASNNFGRTYAFTSSQATVTSFREFEVVPEAWVGLENSKEGGGAFTDGYQLDSSFKFAAPFWNQESNKIKAYAVISGRPKWGLDARATPAQYTEYVEDETFTYVPIEVEHWTAPKNPFDENTLTAFENTAGIIIRLPNVCWQSYLTEDAKLANSPVLSILKKKFGEDTAFDIANPLVLGEVLPSLTGVAIPIKVRKRYGVDFPSSWAFGNGSQAKVEVQDNLAPWNFQPRGNQTSTEILDNEGISVGNSFVVSRNEVAFAEIEKTGLPEISFDSFAVDGEIDHGVTRLSLRIGSNGITTNYKIQSHFPQILKVRPIQQEIQENLEFALKRLETRISNIPSPRSEFRSNYRAPSVFEPQTNDGRSFFFGSTGSRKLEIPVIVTQVINRGGTGNEIYKSREIGRDVIWPRGADNAVSSVADSINTKYGQATAIDGFLQVGMAAVYHYEEQDDGFFEHYFTGGVPLEAGKIIELTSSPTTVNGILVANIRTVPTEVTVPFGDGTVKQTVSPFQLFNVPFANQAQVDLTLQAGDKLLFASHGNKNKITPNSDLGPTGSNNGDGFLYNVGGETADTTDFATVITRPNANGSGAVIQTINATGGTTFTDGGVTNGNTYNINFIGADPSFVEVGDAGTIKIFRESGTSSSENQFRIYMLINKVAFGGSDAFGG